MPGPNIAAKVPALHYDEMPATWQMPSHAFRARQATLLLSQAQREAVTARRRFYSMPWLSPAGQPDDELP